MPSDGTADIYHFGGFDLDMAQRQLRRDGVPLDVNGRYLDALALMVGDAGKLVSKDRFMDEVWRGVPVTDEALTQCIRSLRKQLGDDASNPHFIETVPRYGYRFIAAVDGISDALSPAAPASTAMPTSIAPAASYDIRRFVLIGGAGMIGGGMAGLIGGIVYGLIGMAQPSAGGSSALLVLICIAVLLGLAGGTGVAFGIAATGFVRINQLPAGIMGGAIGGLIVGATAKLVGLDAFNLLIGHSPSQITGPMEGMILGAATGSALWIAARARTPALSTRTVLTAALTGMFAGIAIALLGGQLMLGSLDLLAQQFPQSRLSMGRLAQMFGEDGFGLISRTVTTAFEAMLFTAGTAIAILIARRDLSKAD